MSIALYLTMVVALIAGAIHMLFIRPRQRRRALVNSAMPLSWQSWIAQSVPHYACYSADLRQLLEDRVKIFVAEKAFYGCAGQEVEDRHRVTIAAQACLLSLAYPIDSTSTVTAILLYPSAFRVPASGSTGLSFEQDGVVAFEQDGIATFDQNNIAGDEDIRLGESWEEGRIILSWDDIETELAARQTGERRIANVVLHEFAHLFDQHQGISAAMDAGEPGLAATLNRALADLQHAVETDRETLIDPYGATEPAEFIAVLTETFFEHPLALQQADGELYATISQIYRLDLAALVRQCGEG